MSEETRRRHAGRGPGAGEEAATNVGARERQGSVLLGAGLVLLGLSGRARSRKLLALLGAGLVHRGVTGRCQMYRALGVSTAGRGRQGVLVQRAITIDCPQELVYAFFRRLENLPRFMRHLESVTQSGERRSHWIAKGPAGIQVEWDAEIIDEQPGKLLVWRSLPGSDIENEGTVRFTSAPADRGTEVLVQLKYAPPAGKVGQLLAKLFGEAPEQQIEDDLLHMKEILETGEIPTTKGQSSGAGRSSARRPS